VLQPLLSRRWAGTRIALGGAGHDLFRADALLAQSAPSDEQAVSSEWRVADRSVGMHLGSTAGRSASTGSMGR